MITILQLIGCRAITLYFCKLKICNKFLQTLFPIFSRSNQIQTFKFRISNKDRKFVRFHQAFSISYHYFLVKTIISKSYNITNALTIK
jgi:hypothetical protein